MGETIDKKEIPMEVEVVDPGLWGRIVWTARIWFGLKTKVKMKYRLVE